MYNSSEVVFMSGDINYTEIYLKNGRKMVSSFTLLRHEEKHASFIRVSKKHLINPKYISGYDMNGPKMEVELKNGNSISVSRRRVKNVLSMISAV